MNEYLLKILRKYRKKGILIDTNLLLLYIVGSLNPQLIPNFKRTSIYSIQDFQILSKVIEFCEVTVTTPHILTEVSNFIGKRIEIHRALGKYIAIGNEHFVESALLAKSELFVKFGLTDSGIFEGSKDGYLILTDDGPLAGIIKNKGADVISLDLLRKTI